MNAPCSMARGVSLWPASPSPDDARQVQTSDETKKAPPYSAGQAFGPVLFPNFAGTLCSWGLDGKKSRAPSVVGGTRGDRGRCHRAGSEEEGSQTAAVDAAQAKAELPDP